MRTDERPTAIRPPSHALTPRFRARVGPRQTRLSLALVTAATSAVVGMCPVHRSAAMALPTFTPVSAAARPPVLVVDDQPAESAITLATLEKGGFAAVAESEGDAASSDACVVCGNIPPAGDLLTPSLIALSWSH